MPELGTFPSIPAGPDERQSVNSWFRSLSPEKCAAIRHLHRVKPVCNFVVLGHMLIWAATGLIMSLLDR